MCLTIPKKVISISGKSVILEKPDGSRQNAGTIIELQEGEFVLTQGGIVIEKISLEEAKSIIDLCQEGRRKK
jgi:hydrogenase maturation factor